MGLTALSKRFEAALLRAARASRAAVTVGAITVTAFLVGVAATAVGIGMIYKPAGVIAAGAMLASSAVLYDLGRRQ